MALSLSAASAEAGGKAAALVIDANSGRVLHDNAGSEPRHPASLTKMMTLYLTFETIEAGRLSFSSSIPVSERAADAAPSKLGVDAGSEIALRDAVKALIVKSANDMAIAIAEKIAGSEDDFARLMTKRARQLGMGDTTFRNASGLPDPEQVTTARDMLTLAMRLQDDFPQHYRLFATRTFAYGGKTYRTHNALLGRFPGVDGIKTGYTRASGFNLVSSYRAGGKHVVAAVFGGASAGLRDAHMRMLLARAMEKAATKRTRPAGPQLVAEARPATRPAAKTRASPEQPVRSPSPADGPRDAPAVPPVAAAAAPAADAAAAVAAASAPAAAAPAARIAIARVKTVSVLVPSAPTPEPADPIATVLTAAPAMPESSASAPLAFAGTLPRPDFTALKAELTARAADEPSAAEAARRPLAPASPAPAAEWPTGASETVLTKQSGLGRPPGTLQAQLASFADTGSDPSPAFGSDGGPTPAFADLPAPVPVPVSIGVAPVPARRPLAAPARQAPATGGGGYHVQIGVYRSTAEAERAMAAARTKAAHVLADSAPLAIPLTKGDQQLYRARFAGFDSASATSACNELRRSGLDCFVARPN